MLVWVCVHMCVCVPLCMDGRSVVEAFDSWPVFFGSKPSYSQSRTAGSFFHIVVSISHLADVYLPLWI